MAEALDLALAREPVRMLADRALYWPARARLLVADLHLGKGDTFRAAGIAVPSGGTAHDLARLATLVERGRARELWILGDFLHARRTAAVDAAWRGFRDAHAAVAMAVVPGNHDHAFDPEAAGVERLPDGIVDGPFAFHHAPPPAAVAHVVCGHVHRVLPAGGRSPPAVLAARGHHRAAGVLRVHRRPPGAARGRSRQRALQRPPAAAPALKPEPALAIGSA